MRRLVRLFALLAVTAACLPVGGAAAAPISVTSIASDGPGTLRTAIETANSQAGPDSIQIETTGKIALENKLPLIEGDLAITGPGPESLIVGRDDEGALVRIFEFADGVTGSLTGLTVTDGNSGTGGGILNGSGRLTLTRVAVVGNEAVEESVDAATGTGGGIYSLGPLDLHESVVSENDAVAIDGSSETAAGGGGVFVREKLTIDRSTISGNSVEALGGSGTIEASGGGIYALDDVKIDRSTISGNSVIAEGAGTALATGGGVSGSKGELTSVTITGNSVSAAESFGANLHLPDSPVVRNTLVSDPRGNGESCFGTYVSGGYNLDEDGSCEFGEGSDLAAVIAGLGPLADNGGPTPTHALLAGSIAIDRGNSFGATTDQRGFPRPSDFPAISNKEGGDGSDIGAFELQAPAASSGGVVPILVQLLAADRQRPNTRIVSGPARVGFKRLAKFRFASTEPQSRFQCKVDRAPWRGCRNPFKRKVSAAGGNGKKHVFKVRAIDRFGNVDPSPARFGWRVKKVGD